MTYRPRQRFYPIETEARCYLCGEKRPVAEFAVDRSKRTGRASRCRECDRERARKRYASRAR